MKATPTQTRIQLKNILYCTDLSGAASTALPYAAGLARHFGSSVFALHVRPIVQPFVAPLAWAAVGSIAAFQLGVFQGLRLLVAGFVGITAVILVPASP
jgi:hypothetical protein